jgi:hypothetical protein
MFTKAFLDVLTQGIPSQQDRLTLREVKDAARTLLFEIQDAPKPVVDSPDQSEGDVADLPFFPNPWFEKERVRRPAEERARLVKKEKKRDRLAEKERDGKAEEDRRSRAPEERQRDGREGGPGRSVVPGGIVLPPAPIRGAAIDSRLGGSVLTGGKRIISIIDPLAKGLDGADVLRRMREGTFPSTWRLLPSGSSVFRVLIYALVGVIVGVIVGSFALGLLFGIADLIPPIHNFFVQMHINLNNLPDWLYSVLAGIGAVLGAGYAWISQKRFDLVLLPDGFVCAESGQTQTWASIVIHFQNVAAMDALLLGDVIAMLLSLGLTKALLKKFRERWNWFPDGLLNNALSVTPQTSDGKTMPIVVKKIPTDSQSLRSIVTAYEQFKASSSV